MNKPFLYLILCFFTSLGNVQNVFSQTELIPTITKLIKSSKYAEADSMLEKTLLLNPQDVDALMMKGNVVLNKYLAQAGSYPIILPEDENIFSPKLAGLSRPPQKLNRETVLEAEKYWNACLKIQPNREDILMGLCTMYAMALMKKELLEIIPLIVAQNKKGSSFAFVLTNYARQLKQRGDVFGEYEVFQKICSLYPDNSGIVSDYAAECSANGDLKTANNIIQKALAMPLVDSITHTNALQLFLATGNLEKELQEVKISQSQNYNYYQGLYFYLHGKADYKKHLNAYLAQFSKATDTSLLIKMATVLVNPNFVWNAANFENLMAEPLDRLTIQLLAQKALQDFPTAISPALLLGNSFLNLNNAALAKTYFEKLETAKMDSSVEKDFHFYYAYTLYLTDNFKKSEQYWQKVYTDSNPFKAQAAKYFLGNIYTRFGEIEKAKKEYTLLQSETKKTKFIYLGSLKLKQFLN